MFDFLKKKPESKIDASTKVINTQGRMLWRWTAPECVLKKVYDELDEVQKLYLATLYDLHIEHHRTTVEDEIEIAMLMYYKCNRNDKGRYLHIEVSAHGYEKPLASFWNDLDANVMDYALDDYDFEVAKPTARRLVAVLSQHRCTDVMRVQLQFSRKDEL